MKTKGKIGGLEVAQQKALEFDEKFRIIPSFKLDLISLRKQFTGEENLDFRAGVPRWIPQYSKSEYKKFTNKTMSRLKSMDSKKYSCFEKSVNELIQHYHFSREWRPHLVMLILTGIYDIPYTNYWLDFDEKYPNSVSIIVGQHTTNLDLADALSEVKNHLPKTKSSRNHQYAKSFSDTKDPVFIDAIKTTETPYFHVENLSSYEKIIYDQNKDKKVATQLIYNYRKKQKADGSDVLVEKPNLKEMSDKDYYKREGLKGKKLKRTLDTLKKTRQRLK